MGILNKNRRGSSRAWLHAIGNSGTGLDAANETTTRHAAPMVPAHLHGLSTASCHTLESLSVASASTTTSLLTSDGHVAGFACRVRRGSRRKAPDIGMVRETRRKTRPRDRRAERVHMCLLHHLHHLRLRCRIPSFRRFMSRPALTPPSSSRLVSSRSSSQVKSRGTSRGTSRVTSRITPRVTSRITSGRSPCASHPLRPTPTDTDRGDWCVLLGYGG